MEARARSGTVIYTIGYGSRSLEAFLELLARHEIVLLADVRSQPYSRFKPQFSKHALAGYLAAAGVEYRWLGDSLGGRPADEDCYTDGRVDYGMCRQKPAFQDGIAQLIELSAGRRCAAMCSEGKPQECHRARLIGEMLVERGVEVLHIDESGELCDHLSVTLRLNGGQADLFGPEHRSALSRRRLR